MSTDTNHITSDFVVYLRQKLQLTQSELAQKIAVSQPLVAMWESGDRVPSGPAAILLRRLGEKSQKKCRKRT